MFTKTIVPNNKCNVKPTTCSIPKTRKTVVKNKYNDIIPNFNEFQKRIRKPIRKSIRKPIRKTIRKTIKKSRRKRKYVKKNYLSKTVSPRSQELTKLYKQVIKNRETLPLLWKHL